MIPVPAIITILVGIFSIADEFPIADLVEVLFLSVTTLLLTIFMSYIIVFFNYIGYSFNYFDYLYAIIVYPPSNIFLITFSWYWGYIIGALIVWTLGIIRALFKKINHIYYIIGFIAITTITALYIAVIQNYLIGTSIFISFGIYLLIITGFFSVGFYCWFLIITLGLYIFKRTPKKIKIRQFAIKLK